MQNRKRTCGSREIFEKPLQKTPQIISATNPRYRQISPPPVLLLELDRLYESCGIRILGGEDPSGFLAPGRAAQNQQIAWRGHFSQNFVKFPKSCHRSFSGCRIFLDLSLSESETMSNNLRRGRFSPRSSTGERDILIFVKLFFAYPPSTFTAICPAIVL